MINRMHLVLTKIDCLPRADFRRNRWQPKLGDFFDSCWVIVHLVKLLRKGLILRDHVFDLPMAQASYLNSLEKKKRKYFASHMFQKNVNSKNILQHTQGTKNNQESLAIRKPSEVSNAFLKVPIYHRQFRTASGSAPTWFLVFLRFFLSQELPKNLRLS